MVDIKEMQEILRDYYKTYFRIINNNGICKKSIEYQNKIDRLELMIKKVSNNGC